ncbi:glycosyltransferase [Pannonibacter phragmitetus]|uniref:glycosyltransferase n=1 Tax=Pannonibacter phragmitetus TaxID=121719 RepID=UPI003D2EAB9D
MKILILHHYALPPGGAGGTRHFTLARHLVQRGHEVSIIASRHAYTGAGTVSDAPEDTIDGVRFVWSDAGGRGKWIGGRGLGMLGFARDAYKRAIALARAGQDFDIVVGTSPQPFAAVSAARVARKLRVPYVLEIRDLWPMSVRDLVGWGDYHPGWLLLRQIEKYLYRSADHIMTLLPGSQEWISSSGGARKDNGRAQRC